MKAEEAISEVTKAMHRTGAFKLLKKEAAQRLALEIAGTVLEAYLQGYRQAWCDSEKSLEKSIRELKVY